MLKEHELLKNAVIEIRALRNQNNLMSARLEMFDSVMAVLHTEIARKSQGMSPDITYEIEKFIEKENTITKVSNTTIT